LPRAAVTVTPRPGLAFLVPFAGVMVSCAPAADVLAAGAAGPPVLAAGAPALPWQAALSRPATAQIATAGRHRRCRDEVLPLTLASRC